MPFPGAVFTSSTAGDIGGGRAFTAIKGGPLLIGTQADNVGGPLPPIGGLGLIQSTQPTTNLLTTSAAVVAKASFIYIPQTTNPVATSSFASLESAPPFSPLGAALFWDAARAKLGVYSTASGNGVWMCSAAFTSS